MMEVNPQQYVLAKDGKETNGQPKSAYRVTRHGTGDGLSAERHKVTERP
jgi:hypothetical protein